MLKMTTKQLEEILVKERKNAHEDGMFGIAECKKSIKWQMETFKQTLEEVYVELVRRALTEWGFNTYMIVACERLMEEK